MESRSAKFGSRIRGPRILVTGFSVFPGAPENPTEWLVGRWVEENPFSHAVYAAVLPVSFSRATERLDALLADFKPDIAIHFGLAIEAGGFRLEERARGAFNPEKPDVDGEIARITSDGAPRPEFASTLPIEDIEKALIEANLPVERSGDAGGYLCDHVFHQSCAADGPQMSGFIHVPWLDHQRDRFSPSEAALTEDQLKSGARLIVETAARHWISLQV